jgi:hypothetical protein
MKTKEQLHEKVEELNKQEMVDMNGGYFPPTEEELEIIRQRYGPWGEYIMCW